MEPHVRRDVLPRDEVWVAEQDGRPVGVLTLERDAGRTGGPADQAGPDLIGQLFVVPDAQRVGVGSALLALAKQCRPSGLDLWVFASNAPAQEFSARRGFVVVGGSDGDNEEGAPDLLMRWTPGRSA